MITLMILLYHTALTTDFYCIYTVTHILALLINNGDTDTDLWEWRTSRQGGVLLTLVVYVWFSLLLASRLLSFA